MRAPSRPSGNRPGGAALVPVAAAAGLLLAACATTVNGSATQADSAAVSSSPVLPPTGESPTGESPTGGSPTGGSATTISAPDTDSSAIRTTVNTDLATGTGERQTTSADRTTAASTISSAAPTTTGDWKLPPVTPNQPTNDYGDIVAEAGQSYAVVFGPKDSGHLLVFQATKIVLDPKCKNAKATPVHGHFLRIDLAVEPRNLTEDDLSHFTATFNASGWTVFDGKGTAAVGIDTDAASECFPEASMPYLDSDDLVGGGLFRGTIVLDVPAAKGTALLDLGLPNGGWEYHYG